MNYGMSASFKTLFKVILIWLIALKLILSERISLFNQFVKAEDNQQAIGLESEFDLPTFIGSS